MNSDVSMRDRMSQFVSTLSHFDMMNFGHASSGQFERANVFQVLFMVLFGARK